jgi:hypothetical protein
VENMAFIFFKNGKDFTLTRLAKLKYLSEIFKKCDIIRQENFVSSWTVRHKRKLKSAL